MIRRPRRSTLFPYPTLFRSIRLCATPRPAWIAPPGQNPTHRKCGLVRSEEHTSELQSQSNLVCRLLLEKKNNLCAHELPPMERRCPRQCAPLVGAQYDGDLP